MKAKISDAELLRLELLFEYLETHQSSLNEFDLEWAEKIKTNVREYQKCSPKQLQVIEDLARKSGYTTPRDPFVPKVIVRKKK